MRPVVAVAEMAAIDAEARDAVETSTLVERAGTALATWCLRLLGGAYGRRVTVIAGKGNNGADGKVAARRLSRRGAAVKVLPASDLPERIGPRDGVDLVVDAAFGTGFRGTYRAPAVPAGVPVVAADIPSGVNGDTGEACGEPLRADLTVTFAALKPGLVQGAGPLLSGRVEVADIGLDVGRARIWVVEDDDVANMVPARPRETNKWKAAVAVVAGSPGMTGAAELCTRGAYRAGAGMVRLAVPGGDVGELGVTEAVGTRIPAEGWAGKALEMAQRCRALVVGPGIGRAEGTAQQVRELVARSEIPTVVDADGLVALGSIKEVADIAHDRARRGAPPIVLTPHEGEFARITGAPPAPDRISDVRRVASSTRTVVLLKGSTTVVADPWGLVLLSVAGSPRLATAGTGDVLSGVIAALMARGLPPHEAAALGAHVHGRAAQLGPSEGLVAGDLTDLVARWLSEIRRG
jgi:ADP-dependent NAD(P)H-hydrate dehydratase / NAD(P)H-hydrate epimerase